MKTVTYRGPEDPRDRTTRYRIGEHTLPKGVEVEVPDEVARELKATEGQNFDIAAKKGAAKKGAAKKGAAKKGADDQAETAATKES